MKNQTILYAGAAAIALALLSKKNQQATSGCVSGVWSPNKKLNAVLTEIQNDLEEMGSAEVKHYMRDFPRETDYNIVQYGNLLVYYYDIRAMYLRCGYSPKTINRMSDDQIWETYKRQVGYVARTLYR